MKIEPEVANMAMRASLLQDQERNAPLESVQKSVPVEESKSPDKVDKVSRADEDQKRLHEALETINGYAEIKEVDLLLRLDDDLNEMVVSVVDKLTEEVIRQIPSEHAIDLAKKIDAMMNDFFSSDHSINLFNDEA